MDYKLYPGTGYRGYNPTQNQSEYGTPQQSNYGRILKAAGAYLRGVPTILPGPFHFEDQTGPLVIIPSYATASVVADSDAFGGEVPLSVSPRIDRGMPWQR